MKKITAENKKKNSTFYDAYFLKLDYLMCRDKYSSVQYILDYSVVFISDKKFNT